MAKVLITPIKSIYCNAEPYELEGKLTSKVFDGEKYYYIGGGNISEDIVTVLEGGVEI